MFNTKGKFISFTVLSIVCIILMVVSALFYIQWTGSQDIFGQDIIPFPKDVNGNPIQAGTAQDTDPTRAKAYALISIGFTLSALSFCAAVSIFTYYIIAAANNRKLIKHIRHLKEEFSLKNKVSKDEIDSGLLDIRAQIRSLEKEKVKPIKEVEVKKGKKSKGEEKANTPAEQPAPTPVANPTAPFPAA